VLISPSCVFHAGLNNIDTVHISQLLQLEKAASGLPPDRYIVNCALGLQIMGFTYMIIMRVVEKGPLS